MSNVKHKIFFGFPGTVDVDGTETVETFYLLTEDGDTLVTEDNNNLILENG